jgi:hypothetical protein
MTAIGFNVVLGIKDAAMVINQVHESHTPTHRWVMSKPRAVPARPAGHLKSQLTSAKAAA